MDQDIELFWDKVWIRRIGRTLLPDPEFTEGTDPAWEKWGVRADKFLRDAEDYWFHLY